MSSPTGVTGCLLVLKSTCLEPDQGLRSPRMLIEGPHFSRTGCKVSKELPVKKSYSLILLGACDNHSTCDTHSNHKSYSLLPKLKVSFPCFFPKRIYLIMHESLRQAQKGRVAFVTLAFQLPSECEWTPVGRKEGEQLRQHPFECEQTSTGSKSGKQLWQHTSSVPRYESGVGLPHPLLPLVPETCWPWLAKESSNSVCPVPLRPDPVTSSSVLLSHVD